MKILYSEYRVTIFKHMFNDKSHFLDFVFHEEEVNEMLDLIKTTVKRHKNSEGLIEIVISEKQTTEDKGKN